jgi:hypothetical protein
VKTIKDMLWELVEAGEKIGSENGPDADYKRFAREDAERLVALTARKIQRRKP